MNKAASNERALTNTPSQDVALLPWENADDWAELRDAFHRDLNPAPGPETALVDQLAWIAWRRRRLGLAERAAHLAALERRLGDEDAFHAVIKRATAWDAPVARYQLQQDDLRTAGPAQDAADLHEMEEARKSVARARRAAASKSEDAYERAVALLDEDIREWWLESLGDAEFEEDDDRVRQPTVDGLIAFIDEDVSKHFQSEIRTIEARPAVRRQAQGESFDPDKIERLLKIDEGLDRQFERTLANLQRLQARRLGRK